MNPYLDKLRPRYRSAVGSKYDEFWQSRIEELPGLVVAAAGGSTASVDLSSIKPLGNRNSWAGSVLILGSSVVRSSMAHMSSLGRAVSGAGLCVPWPEKTFVFSMNRTGLLTVRCESSPREPRAIDPAPAVFAPSLTPVEIPTEEVDAFHRTGSCRDIHEVIGRLPRYTDPSQVPFDNGLYFFFELGEDSAHGAPRITRIGNHPQAQDRLVGRLRDHYRTRRDAKNGSVFRRYLGGALLRRDGRLGCLEPAPGRGHWERSHAHECDVCAPYEDLVTSRLASHFCFSCVRIEDQALRIVSRRC